MKRLRHVRAVVAAATVTTGVACALLIPASPAVAYYSGGLFLDVSVQSPATLLADGAAVDVPVDFTCNASSATLYLTVTQQVGGKATATGYGYADVACTGAHQRTLVSVTASGGEAFVKGDAFVDGRIGGCLPDRTYCGTESNSATIVFNRG
jgi:hypothetical protein